MAKAKGVVVLAVLLGLVSVATAKSVTIGPHEIDLDRPDGHCLLDEDTLPDAKLFRIMREASLGKNAILFVSAECGQLERWRTGEQTTLDDFAVAMAPKKLVGRRIDMPKPEYVRRMTGVMEHQGATLMKENYDKVAKNVEEKVDNMGMKGQKSLGILETDDQALYWGVIQSMQTQSGETKNTAGVMAMTLVAGKVVNLYRYTRYAGEGTVADLQESTATWVSQVQAVN